MRSSKFFSGLNKPVQKNVNNFLERDIYTICNEEAISRKLTIIDVRTHEEYNKGRVPNALNFPIFDPF